MCSAKARAAQVRMTSAYALVEFAVKGNQEAISALFARLVDVSGPVRTAAAESLRRATECVDKVAMTEIVDQLDTSHMVAERVAKMVLHELLRRGSQDSLAALNACLEHRDTGVR